LLRSAFSFGFGEVFRRHKSLPVTAKNEDNYSAAFDDSRLTVEWEYVCWLGDGSTPLYVDTFDLVDETFMSTLNCELNKDCFMPTLSLACFGDCWVDYSEELSSGRGDDGRL